MGVPRKTTRFRCKLYIVRASVGDLQRGEVDDAWQGRISHPVCWVRLGEVRGSDGETGSDLHLRAALFQTGHLHAITAGGQKRRLSCTDACAAVSLTNMTPKASAAMCCPSWAGRAFLLPYCSGIQTHDRRLNQDRGKAGCSILEMTRLGHENEQDGRYLRDHCREVHVATLAISLAQRTSLVIESDAGWMAA